MWAVLSDLGIIDSRSDMLTISVIRGINSALHSFRSQVGKGSSSHDLTGDSLIIFHISASVASIKVFSGTPEKQFVTETPVCVSVGVRKKWQWKNGYGKNGKGNNGNMQNMEEMANLFYFIKYKSYQHVDSN